MDGFDAVAMISYLGIGIIGWIVVGMVAGWLSHLITRGVRDTRVTYTALGVVGAMIGGGMFGFLDEGSAGLWTSLAIAFVLGLAFAWIVAIASGDSAR